MGLQIRQLTAEDGASWLELLRVALGDDYPEPKVYESAWVAGQLAETDGRETFGAVQGGRLWSTLSILPPSPSNLNPVANLGRNLFHPGSYANGAAEGLLKHVTGLAKERELTLVIRVFATDNAQQILLEKLGFVCAGFQPFKHLHGTRQGILFYVRFAHPESLNRLPISQSLPQVSELATAVLSSLDLQAPTSVRDGATGYPLRPDIDVQQANHDEFELWQLQVAPSNPPIEVSGGYSHGQGFLRTENESARTLLGRRDSEVVAGLSFIHDERDRCVRVTDSFCVDDLSIGGLVSKATEIAREELNAVYVEMDVLMTAPRMLKTAEQIGFVPVAYLPAFFKRGDTLTDAVKMLKLNMVYSPEEPDLTANAKRIVQIIDHSFQDQKIGIAIISLLGALPIFEGLGDGELRKIARLFTQKLYRPGERVFGKGDSGDEAYVVMRGRIDILLDENTKPIATIGNGQIFGELAFLDGAARGALATASQASILLVVQRSAFNELVHREPHLGMLVMRNIAMELSTRLRRTTAVLSSEKR